VVDENSIDALVMFGVDEPRFSSVQKGAEIVLGKKGKRQIGAVL
jgi:hypothetical protein